MFERTIVSPFGIGREAACGQLPALQMVLDALAADARPGASTIGAGTFIGILFFPAFHQCASAW